MHVYFPYILPVPLQVQRKDAMTSGTRTPAPTQRDCFPPSLGRSRDAGNTRQLLLEAARHRFARDGYSATTVRDISRDAGVNVALINRYFTSKEGLFEACLTSTVDELDSRGAGSLSLDQILLTMASQVAGLPTGEYPLQLLLLLRSSGDERADGIRRNILRSFAERIAVAAGWDPKHPDGDQLMLRAQIALAATMGVVLLRASTGLEPLTSAAEEDLSAPIGEFLSSLLSPSGKNRPTSCMEH